MRWTLKEFIYEMEQDTERRVFFVEGIRDHVFWSKTLGVPRRDGTVVYAISVLECESGLGGERGRLVRIARELEVTSVRDRLRFFADADFDRILGVQSPLSVILTDGRDLESYVFRGRCIERLCEGALPAAPTAAEELKDLIEHVGRPLGILRIASARNNLDLPFQRTLEKGLQRVIVKEGSRFVLDIDRLIRALMQNGGVPMSRIGAVRRSFDDEVLLQTGLPEEQIVHGKDLVGIVAWHFNITRSFAEMVLMLAIAGEVNLIRTAPNISVASAWLV